MSRNDTSSQHTRETVSRFFSNVMQPLARILMRYGYSAREAADVTGWSFVNSYFSTPEFWGEGMPTFMQGAIKTGLPRQKVRNLHAMKSPDNAIFATRQNLAYRVVEGWVNDAEFHVDGAPAPLQITHTERPCFKTLVMKYGNDVTYGPVLKDLESAGCVEVQEGKAVLVNQTYGLNFLSEDKLKIAGFMLRQLAATTDNNLAHPDADQRRLQRFWSQRRIPIDHAEEATRVCTKIAIEAGRKIDQELARIAEWHRESSQPRVEVGIAMYAFEDRAGECVGKPVDDVEQGSEQ